MTPRPGASETPLVAFTVLTQGAAGVVLVRAVLRLLGGPVVPPLAWALALLVVGFAAAALHLGSPRAARYALANLRTSWLAREILLGGALAAAIVVLLVWPDAPVGAHLAAALLALGFVLAVARVYRLRTVPAWGGPATPAAFLGTAVVLGAAGATAALAIEPPAADWRAAGVWLALVGAAVALANAAIGRLRHRPRPSLPIRGIAAIAGAATLLAAALLAPTALRPLAAGAACVLLLLAELAGRTRFYASHRRLGL